MSSRVVTWLDGFGPGQALSRKTNKLPRVIFSKCRGHFARHPCQLCGTNLQSALLSTPLPSIGQTAPAPGVLRLGPDEGLAGSRFSAPELELSDEPWDPSAQRCWGGPGLWA